LIVATPPAAFGQVEIIGLREARRIAEEHGWTIRSSTEGGRTVELMWIVNNIPFYYETHNRNAAATVSAPAVWPGGSSGLSLTGAGVRVGLWDAGGVRESHQDFGLRVTQKDSFPPPSGHATHVAGTIVGAGLSPDDGVHPAGLSRGMAYEGTIHAYDFKYDELEMTTAAAEGMVLSNHSYGVVTGWDYGNYNTGSGNAWYWFGDTRISIDEDYFFGFYSFLSRRWDDIAFEHPGYLIVKSAGNDRNEGPAPGLPHYVKINEDWVYSEAVRSADGNDGYDCLSHAAVSKNVLTVGAVGDLVTGYDGPASVVVLSFSAWGPTDDGRIKPDLVANGNSLWSATASSTDAYESRSGTSMAAASTSGSLALLVQHYRATHDGENPQAALLKGLAIHTADEAGDAPGPDYSYGWGLLNTASAAALISEDVVEPRAMQMLTAGSNHAVEQIVTYDGSGPIRATICWTDPPGTPPTPSLDPTVRMLVNDLDLRIIGPDGTVHEPWRLNPADPAAPAQHGNNDVDNVEMVVIDDPLPGDYVIRVSAASPLADEIQPFAMLLSGVSSAAPVTGACCNPDVCTGTVTEADCVQQGGVWYGGATCAELTCPAIGACCLGCPPEDTCSQTDSYHCFAQGGAWTPGLSCAEATCLPRGDDCLTDMLQVGDGAYPIDNRCASSDGTALVFCDTGWVAFKNDLWFAYDAACTGIATFSMCGDANYDAIMAVYTDGTNTCSCPVDATTQVGPGADDTCGVDGGPPMLQRWVTQGQCYTVRVGGWNNWVGTGTLEITCEPAYCPLADQPIPEATPVQKSRYLSLVPPVASEEIAIRMTAVSLDVYPEFNGTTLWLGPPVVRSDPRSSQPDRTVVVSELQCEPYFGYFGDMGEMHVTGAEIVPASTYTLQTVPVSCAGYLNDESVFSDPLTVTTGQWGDTVPMFATPGGPTQPDFNDIASLVEQFVGGPGAIGKPRAQLQPNAVYPDRSVDFRDIADDVRAFLGGSYDYYGPCTCPSDVICGQTACTDDSVCGDGVCVRGYCADICGRCTPP